MRTSPVTLAPGVFSSVRLRTRRSDVLPEPAGPMMPMISLVATSRLSFSIAVLSP